MKKQLNIKDLADNVIQATEILDAMLDWANGKTKKVNKKIEILDELVNDLTNQVQNLDKKIKQFILKSILNYLGSTFQRIPS